MSLPMLSRPVHARRRGMPGIAMLGKHFFSRFLQPAFAERSFPPKCNSDTGPRLLSMALIVGKIVEFRRRRRYALPALDIAPALASWRNLVFILRTRCGNHGAAGR